MSRYPSFPSLPPARAPARLLAALLAALLIGLPGGFPAPAAAQEAGADRPDSLRETFRDWIVQCVPAQGAVGGQACEMFQQIDHQQSSQRLLLVSVRFEPDRPEPMAVIIAPFGLRLADGLELREEETVVASYPFETCLAAGCLVVAPLELSVIDTLRRGTSLTVHMTARNGDSLGVPLSLAGFARAMDRLDDLAQP